MGANDTELCWLAPWGVCRFHQTLGLLLTLRSVSPRVLFPLTEAPPALACPLPHRAKAVTLLLRMAWRESLRVGKKASAQEPNAR